MITILDYGSGNVNAISRLAKMGGLDHRIVNKPNELSGSTHILLPGVGAFDHTMDQFNRSGFSTALKQCVDEQGAHLLGICVGMHVLASASQEGDLEGLNFIPGTVRRFDETRIKVAAKVPHMGWNAIKPANDHPLFREIDFDRGFYFLHSYHFDCGDSQHALAVTTHGDDFHSVVGKDRVYGVQFHPEKSHENGIQLITNFAGL